MTKVKSNAQWNQLTREQRDTLEDWLFEQRLGYQPAFERAQKELGFTGSLSSLRRFYQRTAQERQITGFSDAARHAKQIRRAAGISEHDLCGAALKTAAMLLLQQVTENPGQIKDWLPLARLMLRSQENENRRQVRDAAHTVRKQKADAERARLQFDALAEAEKVLPQLNKIALARRTPLQKARDRYKFRRNITRVRLELFGCAPDALPESKADEELLQRSVREDFQFEPESVREYNARRAQATKEEEAEEDALEEEGGIDPEDVTDEEIDAELAAQEKEQHEDEPAEEQGGDGGQPPPAS